MTPDAIFDDMADPDERRTLGSNKAESRVSVLLREMLEGVPRLANGGLRILDAGGGAGHIAIRLAELGHEVVLCDASAEMCQRARKARADAEMTDRVSIVHAPIQHLSAAADGPFDVIACHSVLEWLSDPHDTLDDLVSWLQLEGEMSLLFHTQPARPNSVPAYAERHALPPCDAGSTPTPAEPHPLSQHEVCGWIGELGFDLRSKAVLTLADVPLHTDSIRPVQASEAPPCSEPFASPTQHTHLVCAPAG